MFKYCMYLSNWTESPSKVLSFFLSVKKKIIAMIWQRLSFWSFNQLQKIWSGFCKRSTNPLTPSTAIIQMAQQLTPFQWGEHLTHSKLLHEANCFSCTASPVNSHSEARNTQLSVHRVCSIKLHLGARVLPSSWHSICLAGYLRARFVVLVSWASLSCALLLDYQKNL